MGRQEHSHKDLYLIIVVKKREKNHIFRECIYTTREVLILNPFCRSCNEAIGNESHPLVTIGTLGIVLRMGSAALQLGESMRQDGAVQTIWQCCGFILLGRIMSLSLAPQLTQSLLCT